jgi:hypothetical protein
MSQSAEFGERIAFISILALVVLWISENLDELKDWMKTLSFFKFPKLPTLPNLPTLTSSGGADSTDYGDADGTSLFNSPDDQVPIVENVLSTFTDAWIPTSKEVKEAGYAGTVNGNEALDWAWENRLF